MGQKIHPLALRTGVTKQWPVRWLARGNFKELLQEDEAIRSVVHERCSQGGIAGVEIDRKAARVRVTVKAARPGLIIGRGGKGVEELTKALERALVKLRGGKVELSLNIEELKRTEISAQYTAQQIAWDLERRMPFRRTIKRYLEQMMQNRTVKGAKIFLSGRLDGREIARREWLRAGELPLQTLRADIDYGTATAFCTYGTIGVKVWIYKGEIFANKPAQNQK
ncbi:MAG: 30S ribosomal protein S3 [Candidatus Liptonbacteria bacterium]|nr:30S ribosomal protein S3 [Candidatus Liptonbacteria bacterium]